MDIAIIAVASAFATLCLIGVYVVWRDSKKCQMCGKPRDPKSAVPGTWKYGLLVCDEHGRELDEKYSKDPPPPYPPYPPP